MENRHVKENPTNQEIDIGDQGTFITERSAIRRGCAIRLFLDSMAGAGGSATCTELGHADIYQSVLALALYQADFGVEEVILDHDWFCTTAYVQNEEDDPDWQSMEIENLDEED